MITENTYHQSQFEAIGTRWNIRAMESLPETEWAGLLDGIRQRIESFDKTYSRFRSDSVVARAGRRAGRYELPADGYDLLRFYEDLYGATGGKLTPLIGETMEASGYDATYSFSSKELSRPPRWEEILAFDEHSLTLARPAVLDFGAAGKGYLVDIVAGLMEHAGLRSYLIDAGGDIRFRAADGHALEVGLENPLDTSEAVGVARLKNQSLCASAGSKRRWDRFHHIMDPVELRSPSRVLASWAAADDTMTADGLATALFFADPARLRKRFAFSYAVLTDDMKLSRSPDFPAEFFSVKERHESDR